MDLTFPSLLSLPIARRVAIHKKPVLPLPCSTARRPSGRTFMCPACVATATIPVTYITLQFLCFLSLFIHSSIMIIIIRNIVSQQLFLGISEH